MNKYTAEQIKELDITGEAIVFNDILPTLGKYEVIKEHPKGAPYTWVYLFGDASKNLINMYSDVAMGYLIWHMGDDGHAHYYQPSAPVLRFEVV